MSLLNIHHPASVLLIEDSRDDEMLALRALRTCGLPLAVRVARNGACARRMLGLDETPREGEMVSPSLILSDLKLPGMNGFELLCRCRTVGRLKVVPFVLFSSSNEPSDIERCLQCGADAYVQKPVDFEEYIDCVHRTVRWALEGFDEQSMPACVVARALYIARGRRD